MAESTGPMDGLNTERLQAILDLLVESGVEEFEGYGIHVRFTAGLFTPDRQVTPIDLPPPTRADAETIWKVPELWPGGKPPSFPGKPIK